MGDCDECGEPTPSDGNKNTFTIHRYERIETFDVNSKKVGMTSGPGCSAADPGQELDFGAVQGTFDIHNMAKKGSCHDTSFVCSSIDKPWMTNRDMRYIRGKGGRYPEPYITEYMDQFRCKCPSRIGRWASYHPPLPVDCRPEWNRSPRVPCKPYHESLEASEAKLRILDGLLGEELDPQDAMILMIARQDAKERFRQEVGACGCPGATFRFSEPIIQKTKQIRIRVNDPFSSSCGQITRQPPPTRELATPSTRGTTPRKVK